MHTLEPYFNWHSYYLSSEDLKSPFFGKEYSEFEFTHSIYNHAIHPQWDDIGSPTLFIKILFADYDEGVAIIELIGEWNDCINNDIMFLKRDVADLLIKKGINKFILIGENVFNFHHSDDCYYEEWFDDIDDGWIAFLNFREHVVKEFQQGNIDYYIVLGGILNELRWRTLTPVQLVDRVSSMVMKRLG
ncbi:MAG: hypothetical protein M3Q58_05800 [Bacteroidota bacterium]|nr:hypothetical protein [Bacteroidota bacterium]